MAIPSGILYSALGLSAVNTANSIAQPFVARNIKKDLRSDAIHKGQHVLNKAGVPAGAVLPGIRNYHFNKVTGTSSQKSSYGNTAALAATGMSAMYGATRSTPKSPNATLTHTSSQTPTAATSVSHQTQTVKASQHRSAQTGVNTRSSGMMTDKPNKSAGTSTQLDYNDLTKQPYPAIRPDPYGRIGVKSHPSTVNTTGTSTQIDNSHPEQIKYGDLPTSDGIVHSQNWKPKSHKF